MKGQKKAYVMGRITLYGRALYRVSSVRASIRENRKSAFIPPSSSFLYWNANGNFLSANTFEVIRVTDWFFKHAEFYLF